MDFCESYPIAVALVSSGSRGNRLLFYHRGQSPGHCGKGMSLRWNWKLQVWMHQLLSRKVFVSWNLYCKLAQALVSKGRASQLWRGLIIQINGRSWTMYHLVIGSPFILAADCVCSHRYPWRERNPWYHRTVAGFTWGKRKENQQQGSSSCTHPPQHLLREHISTERVFFLKKLIY